MNIYTEARYREFKHVPLGLEASDLVLLVEMVDNSIAGDGECAADGLSEQLFLCLKCRGFDHKVAECPQQKFVADGDGLEWICSSLRSEVRRKLSRHCVSDTPC